MTIPRSTVRRHRVARAVRSTPTNDVIPGTSRVKSTSTLISSRIFWVLVALSALAAAGVPAPLPLPRTCVPGMTRSVTVCGPVMSCWSRKATFVADALRRTAIIQLGRKMLTSGLRKIKLELDAQLLARIPRTPDRCPFRLVRCFGTEELRNCMFID